ncbi:AhpC/TSA family protein [Joostella atrarenae]|uniref:AhpC/TSA family protein n=1 Tax=Joostella atrarenae TaxID=679257 RepID=A0ABS9J1V8_9FLAO|nr:peroxiredoxin-like family protein [Joostella atrarenae]MCF8714410.1 AhpC/TSA family protein [Joostella atrarenae]
MLIPTKKVPNLKVALTNGDQWELSSQLGENFTMIVYYRGLHCPVCKNYLEDLAKKLEDFKERGVNVIAVSANTKELAIETTEKWRIPGLTLGYGMSIEEAREWGLYVSNGISDKEPKTFFEPGLFLILPDQTLYACSLQSMPFARPEFKDVLNAISYVNKTGYPARGDA